MKNETKGLLILFLMAIGIISWTAGCLLIGPLFPEMWPFILSLVGGAIWILGALVIIRMLGTK